MDIQNYLQVLEYMEANSSTSDSSDEESGDEEFLSFLNRYSALPRLPQKKKFYKRENMIEKYDDEEFEQRFRLPKDMVHELVDSIKPNVKFKSNRNRPILVLDQVLITLRYYATGSFQIVTGDLFGVSQPSVSRIILRISKQIAALAKEEIKFPHTYSGLRKLKEEFYAIKGIPHVVGIIDGTHIPIQSIGGNQAECFRNRKGYFSINTQIVCDAQMRIMDINARWPGSCHDQMTFNFSKLHARFEAGEFYSGVLLGDSGYACRNYLITPITNPSTDAEITFNNSFVKTRRLVEQTIGVWKRRFPVLCTKIALNIETTVIIIVATAVLHNKLKQRRVPQMEINIDEEFSVDNEALANTTNYESDFTRRNDIIQNFF